MALLPRLSWCVLALSVLVLLNPPASAMADLSWVTGSWSSPRFPETGNQLIPPRSPALTGEPHVDERCAVAQAHVWRGATVAMIALRQTLPIYEGRRTTVLINRWSEHVFLPWFVRTHGYITAATQHYIRAAELRCLPWTLESARALGAMYERLGSELEKLPVDAAAEDELRRAAPHASGSMPHEQFLWLALEFYELV